MKVAFYFSAKDRERELASAFISGVKIYSDAGQAVPVEQYRAPDADVAVVIGVKSLPLKLVKDYQEAGRKVVFIDKGHLRREAYWRVSVGEFMPTRYLMELECSDDRAGQLDLDLKPMRGEGESVLFAGASEKYHICRGLPDATEFAKQVCHDVQVRSNKLVIYRPKPSWSTAVPVPGTFFSRPPRTLQQEMKDASVLVTYASNAAAEGIVDGVPAIVLGDGVAKPVAGTSLDALGEVALLDDDLRWRWLSKIAYCQWTVQEFRSGEAWEFLSDVARKY